MSEVTHLLQSLEHGDLHAAHQLLPLVYQELRKLARAIELNRQTVGNAATCKFASNFH